MTQMRGAALKNGEKWVKLEYGLRQKQDCGLVDHGVWAVSFQVTQETSRLPSEANGCVGGQFPETGCLGKAQAGSGMGGESGT